MLRETRYVTLAAEAGGRIPLNKSAGTTSVAFPPKVNQHYRFPLYQTSQSEYSGTPFVWRDPKAQGGYDRDAITITKSEVETTGSLIQETGTWMWSNKRYIEFSIPSFVSQWTGAPTEIAIGYVAIRVTNLWEERDRVITYEWDVGDIMQKSVLVYAKKQQFLYDGHIWSSLIKVIGNLKPANLGTVKLSMYWEDRAPYENEKTVFRDMLDIQLKTELVTPQIVAPLTEGNSSAQPETLAITSGYELL